MKYLSVILVTAISLITFSCQEDLFNKNAGVSFKVSERLFEGRKVDCIETGKNGEVWIGSGSEIYYRNGSVSRTYELPGPVLSMAAGKDNTLWIGTDGKGLGCLSDNKFTWYTAENSGLPRDYIRHVETDPSGHVWFSSCAFRIGGLGHYDGKRFEFMTPDNSPLNQNVIEDIEIDDKGAVYIATTGTVVRTNIYRIMNGSWECLGNEEGTFYWVFSFTIGPSGTIYLVEDFSLSSAMHTNKIYCYKDNKWGRIDSEGMPPSISFFSRIKADARNYCWLGGTYGDNAILNVYTGREWIVSPDEILSDNYITVIETDIYNNVWVGTYSNGVYVFNQK